MSVEITSEGLAEILEELRELGEEFLPLLLQGTQNGLRRIATEAKTLAPERTGRLRGSIGSAARIEGDHIEGDVHANAEYAVYVEMGTGQQGHDSEIASELGAMYTVLRGDKPFLGQPARPFLHPAVKAGQWKIPDSILRALRKRRG